MSAPQAQHRTARTRRTLAEGQRLAARRSAVDWGILLLAAQLRPSTAIPSGPCVPVADWLICTALLSLQRSAMWRWPNRPWEPKSTLFRGSSSPQYIVPGDSNPGPCLPVQYWIPRQPRACNTRAGWYKFVGDGTPTGCHDCHGAWVASWHGGCGTCSEPLSHSGRFRGPHPICPQSPQALGTT